MFDLYDEDDFYDDDDIADDFEAFLHNKQPLDILQDLLHTLTVSELRQMARRRVWQVKGTRKDDVVKQVAQQMLDSLNDPTMFDDLTKDERELLAATNTMFGLSIPIQPEQFKYVWKDILKKKGTPVSTIEGLVSYGLFIKMSDQWDSDFIYYQPLLPIANHLVPIMPLISPEFKRSSGQTSLVPTFPAPSFVNQIERVGFYAAAGGYVKAMDNAGEFEPEGHENPWIGDWPYLAEEEDKIGRTSYFRYMSQPPTMTVPIRPHTVDQQTFHALRDVTNSWDGLDVIINYLHRIGLIDLDQSSRRYTLDAERWQEYLNLSEAEKLQDFINVWQSGMMDMYELRLFLRENQDLTIWRMAHPDLPYRSFVFEFVLARQLFIRLLRGMAEETAHKWYSVNKFISEVLDLRPDIYHMLSSHETWGFRKGEDYLITLEEPEVWDKAVASILQSLFAGLFYWLGIIELHIRNGQPDAFRVTDLGRYLLSPSKFEPPAENEAAGEAEWVDSQTITIIPGRDLNELMGLISRIAIPISGRASSYRIGGPGLEGIFADGETPESLAAQFETLGYPLPAQVQQHLAKVYERFGRVHLYDEVTVIEFSDDTALVELRAAGLLDNIIIYEYSPRLIVIDPEQVDELAKALEKKGYTPTVTAEAS